jgi:arylformamidase
MFAQITHKGRSYKADLSKPFDISIPLRAGDHNVNAWWAKPVVIEPVRMGDWVGDVNQGGSVNFRDISFNPHGNGTHTECVGHISKEDHTINQCLREFFFIAEVITVLPDIEGEDKVITKAMLEPFLQEGNAQAVVIRTLTNPPDKINAKYSGTNPPYIHVDAVQFLLDKGIDHILIDTPSVDREQDEGKLAAHHLFWNYPANTQVNRTITELIFVPNHVLDGTYLLNLMIAPFENDASPSKPVLYRLVS